MACFAIGAAFDPCSACSAKTRPQSAGCRAARRTRTSRGRADPRSCARPRRARPRARSPAPCRSCPRRRSPGIRARPPVPAPLTTIHSPSRIACRVSGFIATVDCGAGAGTGFQPLPSSTAFRRCGVTRVPPLASVAIVDRHRDRRHRHLALADRDRDRLAGVPLLVRSPAASTRSTARGPGTSFGRSMPLFSPRPSSVAHLWILSMPDHVADRVEVHVARLLDRVAQVHRAVAARLPALERAAVEDAAPAAVDLEVRRDHAFFERRGRDGHLEGRTRRVAPLNRAIVQRPELVGVERRPASPDRCPAANAFGS